MQRDLSAAHKHTFGDYELFPALGLLLKAGTKVEIGAKAFEVLTTIVAAEGAVVSKDHLLTKLWPEQIIEENALQAQMSAIRRALGPDKHFIGTDFGKGYRFVPSGSASEPLASAIPKIPVLPKASSPLIGREREIIELCDAVAPGAILTITGTGGIGKTRLSLEVGSKLNQLYPDGSCLVELASIADPTLVLQTIASKLHLDLSASQATTATNKFRSSRMLLILDSCEHVLAEVALAAKALLETAPGLAILTTSQEPLGVDGEQVYRLLPLPLPPPLARSLKEALQYSSVQLLFTRIRSGDRTLKLDDTHVSDICDICRQLDGIPLAIELAAARVPLIGLRSVVKGLSDRFKLLTAGRRSALPRHQTLRATLEWSYGLLNGEEQRVLCCISLFAGSFTLAAADSIASPDQSDDWNVTNVLASLVSKSLVTTTISGTTTRFRLYESMRAFALEKLAPTGTFSSIAHRHANYFRSRLGAATRHWRELSSEQWLDEYRHDLNDVRAALDWIFSEQNYSQESIRLLCASLPFWMQLSLLDECRTRVERALDQLSQEAHHDKTTEVQLTAALGTSLAWVNGPIPSTRNAWTRTLDLAEDLGDLEYRFQAHYGLWLYHLRIGDYTASLAHGEALFKLGADHDDYQAIATGERTIGVSQHFLGNHLAAAEAIKRMLADAGFNQRKSFPFRFGIDQRVAGLSFLSRIIWVAGEPDEAELSYHRAIDEAQQLDHGISLCCALLEGACTTASFQRDHEALRSYAESAILIAEKYSLGFWRSYAGAFRELSFVMKTPSLQNIEQLSRAIADLDQSHLAAGYSIIVSEHALALGSAGILDKALDVTIRLAGDPTNARGDWARPEFMRAHATLLRRKGLHREAVEFLRIADELACAQGARGWADRISMEKDGETFG